MKIRHRTHYRYPGAVTMSYNEARLTPLTVGGQLALQNTVAVDPAAAVFRYRDYWGTVVDAFDLHRRHGELVVTGESLVETAPPSAPPAGDWDLFDDPAVGDRHAEFLAPSTFAPADLETGDVARHLRRHDLVDIGAPVGAWIRDRLAYRRGATGAHTTATEALRAGEGVCQDFAHVALTVLRDLGVPARYVSGYFFPHADAAVGDSVIGESHAWIEFWAGDWIGVDVTTGEPVGERHVVVARGRDYDDVPPLKGVYFGPAGDEPEVTVELTRLR